METWLVESAIRATVIVSVCALVLWAARVKAPVVLHAVWAGVVVAMLILPAWALWGPEARIALLPQHTPEVAAASTPRLNQTITRTQSASAPRQRPAVGAPPGGQPQVSGWRAVALAIYIVVALILLARLVAGTLSARTLVRHSSAGAGHLTSAACASPVTVGWLRPVVILPESCHEWSERKLDAVLTHEREHAHRRHPFVQWLALCNRAMFWFHPIAWWLPRHLSVLAEQTCDDAVLARGHDARDYSRYLLETASAVGPAGRIRLAGVFMPGHQVSRRIRRMLTERHAPVPSRARGAAVGAVCAIVCLAAISATPIRATLQAPAWSGVVIRPVQPRVMDPDSPQPVSLSWLDGDEWAFEIQPIASSDELAAYGRLANARDREAFVEQFWARRDPSPGTPANEFREEYRRRIAFARTSFETSSGMGFDTDRGRMHLMFGAPDAIERENTPIDRFEIWRYASIPGLGRDLRIRFPLSRDQYCGLRLVSPAPPRTRGAVGLYPLGLTTIAIPVDARTTVGVQYELRTRSGKEIDQGEIGFMDETAAAGSLASHVPSEWFANGFGCTHSLPPDSYTLTTAVRRVNGATVRDSVTFTVE